MKKFLFLIIFLLLFSNNIISKDSYGSLIVKRINSVYDGDTFRCDINGVHPIIGDNISIRIAGIDTPEMRTKDYKEKAKAIEARNALYNKLMNSKKVILKNIQRPKYFRILADVYIDGVNISEYMIDNGYAEPYFGGKKN